jgi:hypothetical protein
VPITSCHLRYLSSLLFAVLAAAGCASEGDVLSLGGQPLVQPICDQQLSGGGGINLALCPDPGDVCGDGVCSFSETCSSCSFDCGSCTPPPDIIQVPGSPTLIPMSALYSRAASLGVSPMTAGVPGISAFMRRPVPFSYPIGASSVTDFMNRLFQNGIWANTTPGQTETALPPDANGCQLKQIDAMYQPSEFVSFDTGAGLLFPGALLQGRYVNLGIGSVIPLHIPAAARRQVVLVDTMGDTAVAPSPAAADVYPAISGMIQQAQQRGAYTQAETAFEMTTASSLGEAASKFKLDAKLLGGSISASFSQSSSTQSNTVFVRYVQSLFSVFQDLGGATPTAAEIGNYSVGELEGLGANGELGYDNLPTYIRNVTYGRMLIFSLTSTASRTDLEAAVNAVYGSATASASTSQRTIIQNSTLRVFSYGGATAATDAVIRSGNWQSYFTMMDVPLATLRPLGYEVRRLDDVLAAMSRTTSYTQRTCNGPKRIHVVLSNTYKNAFIDVKASGAVSYQRVGQTVNGFTDVDITDYLAGSNDKVKISVQVGSTDIFNPSHAHVQVEVYADGTLMRSFPYWECNRCNSQDVRAFLVNQFTGQVTDTSI